MSNRRYVRIVSWHVIRQQTAVAYWTLCGRRIGLHADTMDELPAAASCETCARIVIWQDEAG